MGLNLASFMKTMIARMNFLPEDKEYLRKYENWGLEIAPLMADHFYAYLNDDEEMSKLISDPPDRIERLKKTFIAWFHEMFSGIDDWGEQYAKRRWQIGLIHVRLGIGPQHVVPAMAAVVQAVGNEMIDLPESQKLQQALQKICMIDLTFIEQAYLEVSAAAVLKETGWSEGLFRRLILTGTRNTQID